MSKKHDERFPRRSSHDRTASAGNLSASKEYALRFVLIAAWEQSYNGTIPPHDTHTFATFAPPGDISMPDPLKLPPLPWAQDALEPVISARTIGLHYGKHHATYVKKLNELVAGTRFADMSLEHVIAASAGSEENQKIFNNAAQAWNHTFFWSCLKPGGGGEPERAIVRQMEESFGGFAQFKEKLSSAAVESFGSGWAWLVARGDKLEILATPNAGNP